MKDAIIQNIFMIVVTIGYTAYMSYHYYKLKKQGGAFIKEYTHRSSVKTVAYVLIVLGIFYLAMFIMEKDKNATKIFTMLLFLYFIAIVAFISLQNIKLFENGMYFSGKFTAYSQMKDIERVKNSIQVNLNKKGWANLIFIGKVDEDNDFVGVLRRKLKINKKKKK
ncbi:hypothetical protein HMPREF1142_0483 [Peptostreptococcaceae bacterium AS15]|nr:hypothetical protein HMPREF1142_0483 [Peptostreptococcaceae bacterium AS15]